MLLTWLNKKISESYKKNHKPKSYIPLLTPFEDLLKKHGEGLYLCCLKADSKDILSKIIGYFSSGYSHCVIFLYSEDLKKWFSELDWLKIEKSLYECYGKNIVFTGDMKTLVVSSADAIGMTCFNFSHYQLRKMTLRKIPANEFQNKLILKFLTNIIGKAYDFTGLLGWLSKSGDDKYTYYCSEEVDAACRLAGILIAPHKDPSPGEIEKFLYTQLWKVYINL
jgi:hypothetical protein